MKKVLTIVGARPQFIKASVLSRAFKNSDSLYEVMVHTGQHFDRSMSEIFFTELGIPEPKYNLGISGISHGAMTGRMLEQLESAIMAEDPDMVLVYGDTNSTLAGALAAKKLHKPLAHVEAGLRSFDMKMPEEINRILTDRISDVLYCPTETAVNNLKAEGFDNFGARIVNTGDVMYDSVLYFRQLTRATISTITQVEPFAFCTVHRAENTDDRGRLSSIFSALDEINETLPVVLPLHPRTRQMLERFGIATNVAVSDPVGYVEVLDLLSRCSIVLTDSGGLQKEAFFLGKQCITLRDTTEWTELVEGEFNMLVGANRERIVAAFKDAEIAKPDFAARPYGKGHAGEIIVADLEAFLI